MRKNHAHIRSAIAALLVGVLLLCALFIVAEAHHDCCGDECAVCACIRLCERVLHTLRAPGTAAAAPIAPALAFAALLPLLPVGIKASPVSEKVRIDE